MAESLDDFLGSLGKSKSELNNIASTPIGTVLQDFAKEVVFSSQQNLQEAGRIGSGSLSQSIEPRVMIGDKFVYTIDFIADYYWKFIDQGVNGIENNFGAPYSFKTPNPSQSMIDSFMGEGGQNWLASKGITSLSYVDKNGNGINKPLVTDKDYRGAAYVLARGTKKKGIQPTYYLSSNFSDERIDQLDNDLLEAFINTISDGNNDNQIA